MSPIFRFWAQQRMYWFYYGAFFSSVITFSSRISDPIFTYDTSKDRIGPSLYESFFEYLVILEVPIKISKLLAVIVP